jgi:hypothetical protein
MGGRSMDLRRRVVVTGGLFLLVLAATIGPALAKPLERIHFHDSSSEVVEGFCGDLTVRFDVEVDVTFLLNSHGPDGLAFGSQTRHGTETLTNLANGKTITRVFNFVDKDFKVTDNGDGTLTVVVLDAGGDRWFGPDGKVVFRDPGQTRFAFLVDHAGTPTDPSDDQFLEFLGVVKGSTGRNDLTDENFCDQMRSVIG